MKKWLKEYAYLIHIQLCLIALFGSSGLTDWKFWLTVLLLALLVAWYKQ